MTRTATVVRLRTGRAVKLDDGPGTIQLVQEEIFRSGWAYRRIAEQAGVGYSTICKIACGETRRPALATIARILMALGWELIAQERRG